uniref:Uncharacterized protein n=1 Tax=Panstrongylus lignarius TaxID=156445 RepID=A0A224Y395_9HEMI
MIMARFMQVFTSFLWNSSAIYQFPSCLPSLQYTMVLFGIDINWLIVKLTLSNYTIFVIFFRFIIISTIGNLCIHYFVYQNYVKLGNMSGHT